MTRLITALAPETILAIGFEPRPELDALLPIAKAQVYHLTAPEALEPTRLVRVKLALVGPQWVDLDKPEAMALVARLRDLFSETLYVLLPPGQGPPASTNVWEAHDLIALGLELMRTYPSPDGPWSLFRYAIHSYRTAPDWLNSRYWAHPELWDKFRW